MLNQDDFIHGGGTAISAQRIQNGFKRILQVLIIFSLHHHFEKLSFTLVYFTLLMRKIICLAISLNSLADWLVSAFNFAHIFTIFISLI